MEPGSTSPFGGGIVVTDRRWHRHVPNLMRLVEQAMRVAGCNADIVLTDDRTIKRLNARDRQRNKPTNVLTYDYPPEILLGYGVVSREARLEGKTLTAHLLHLLVHGALHLHGYDHQHAGDANRMEREEAWLLACLKQPNPWKNR